MRRALPLFIVALVASGPSAAEPIPRAPSGAVNPNPGVRTYRCANGPAIVAGYPDPTTAVVTYKDHAYTLKLAVAASGARYTGYGLQWWVKGQGARLSALKPGESIASDPGFACSAEAAGPGVHTRP